MTQIGQRSLDASIAPTAVLFCHTHNQILDLLGFSRSAASPLAAAVVFLCDQPSMPGQQSLGRDNRGHLLENLPSQSLGLSGQSAALVIVEPQSLSAQLLAKNSVLFPKVVDQLQLLLVHPSGYGDQHEPERVQECCHVESNIMADRAP